jgi:hypothetical protein
VARQAPSTPEREAVDAAREGVGAAAGAGGGGTYSQSVLTCDSSSLTFRIASAFCWRVRTGCEEEEEDEEGAGGTGGVDMMRIGVRARGGV